jgi:uncharacterized protein with HEPN domain
MHEGFRHLSHRYPQVQMEKIGLFLQDMSYEQFSSDEKTISAVRDKMIIIGEVGK